MPSKTRGVHKVDGGYLVRKKDYRGKDRRIKAPNFVLAQEIAHKIESDRIRHRHGLHTEQERLTFQVAWDEWLARYKEGSCSKVKPTASTVQAVLERRPHLDPLNSLFLEEIDQHRLEKIGLGLVRDGKAALAARVVGLAKRVLKDAQDRDVRVNASAFRVSFPVPAGKDARAFTWAEVELLASFVPEALRRAVPFLALTGLRVSEFCALTDADVFLHKTGPGTVCSGEPTGAVVSVAPVVSSGANQEACRSAGNACAEGAELPHVGSQQSGPAEVDEAGEIQAGSRATEMPRDRVGGASYILIRKSKTSAGVRRVYLTDHAALLVREQMLARPNPGSGERQVGGPTSPGDRRRQVHEAGTPAQRPRPLQSQVLFPNEHGEPYTRGAVYSRLRYAGRLANLPGARCHELRHTYVSLCASAGVPFDVVRAQVGWSERTAALMWSHYRRLFEGEAVRMVQRLDALVAPAQEEAVTA